MINHVVLAKFKPGIEVVKKIQEICDDVLTVDFEGSDAGSTNIERPVWDFKPITKI